MVNSNEGSFIGGAKESVATSRVAGSTISEPNSEPAEQLRRIDKLRDALFVAVQAEPSFQTADKYQFPDRASFNEAIGFTERCWDKVQRFLAEISQLDYFIIGSFAVDSLNGLDAISRPHNDIDIVVPEERLEEIRQILSTVEGIVAIESDEATQTVSAWLFLSEERDEPNLSIDIMGAEKETDNSYSLRGAFIFNGAEFVQPPRELLGHSARFASRECVVAAKQIKEKIRGIDIADLKTIGVN
ncbi:MAG: hypothetical protein V1898_00300 [Patescibacteria group bacterium]